jgi:hypothetical protein
VGRHRTKRVPEHPAEQAVAALNAAVADAAEPKERDFDALRPREDFQNLVRELETKAATLQPRKPEK